MPLRNEPKTLRVASMTSIARHFDLICYNCKSSEEMNRMMEDDSYLSIEGPFVNLPTNLIQEFLLTIESQSNSGHVHKKHLNLLLQPQLDNLKLSSSSAWNVGFEAIQTRCKTPIYHLIPLQLMFLTCSATAPSLCNGLQEAIQSVKGPLRKRHLFTLLHQYQEEFRIGEIADTAFALLLLKDRCLRLRRLDLSYLLHVNPGTMLKLIPNLTQLVFLNLQMTEIVDQFLDLIGYHCKNLMELDISHCPVTNEGLYKLCYDEQKRKKKCTKLVRLSVAETLIDKQAICFLLLKIPTLRDLDFDNTFQVFNLMSSSAAIKMSEVDRLPVFHLGQLSSNNDCVNEKSVDATVNLCPMATHVTLNNSFIENEILYKIMALENLTHLRITNDDNLSLDFLEGVLPVLTIRGHRLLSLLLARFTFVDIQAIGDCCPKLKNLALSEIGFFEEILFLKSDIFTEITALEIWTSISVETMDKTLLKQLLLNCSKIQNLLVSGGRAFTDTLFMEILKVNEMSQLSRLTLDNCPGFSRSPLDYLFDSTNALTMVRIWSCFLISREDNDYLQKRIKKENCDLYLEWFSWQG